MSRINRFVLLEVVGNNREDFPAFVPSAYL